MLSRRIHHNLVQPAEGGRFSPAETDGLPDAVRHYFAASVAEGTPLARSARFWMRGSIKVGGRWLRFRATQLESPHGGFVWAARAGTVIVGSDRYVGGAGGMDWRILGLVPVAHASGADVTRSAAGRGMAEAIWVPTALLPRFGVRWTEVDPRTISYSYELDGYVTTVQLALDEEGLPTAVDFERWGDPDETGTWSAHRFGFEVKRHATFGGVTIPATGAAGWRPRTEGWKEGEFFRSEIVRYELLGVPVPGTGPATYH